MVGFKIELEGEYKYVSFFIENNKSKLSLYIIESGFFSSVDLEKIIKKILIKIFL
jgi:hypothetical protein